MTKTVHTLLLVLASALVICSGSVRAEDTDIYVDNSGTTGTPNVLLILDNAAAFSASAANTCTYIDDGGVPSLGNTAGGVEQCALYNTVYALQAGTVNIGLMVYESNNIRDVNNSNCGNSNGGCLVQPLIPMSGTAKTTFLAWIRTWKTTGGSGDGYIKSSTERTGAVMQEAWAYYKGSTGLSGRNYAGIQPPAGCQKNFVIFVGNAFGNAGSPGDGGSASVLGALGNAGASTAQQQSIAIPSGSYGTSLFSCGNYTMGNHTDSSGLYGDEWARFMKQTDIFDGTDGNQGIVTYTIGFLGASCKPDYPALLTSMAKVGGAKYFATSSYDEIKAAITKILNEVQAVNSVFSSATLPVSVNAQGTYRNQIYLGMFRPDPSGSPRWIGNLKQYQFALQYTDATNDPNTAALVLADANGDPAISSAGTGFITPNAVSYWTYKNLAAEPDLSGGFYANDSRGTGLTFDSPDGEQVDKGGAGQQIRKLVLSTNYATTPASPRKVYTFCPGQYPFGGFWSVSGSCAALLSDTSNAFATSNTAITESLLNSQSALSVGSITRAGTVATASTASAHGFAAGDQVTIAGANQPEYNGIQFVTGVPSATQFTYAVPDAPPSPATGSYAASIPGFTPKAATSITRIGSTATAVVTAHGFSTGNTVTISGANQFEYNNNFVITKVDNNTFRFTVVETPISPAGSGTATVGGVTKSIEAVNANPSPGVVRATGSTTVTVTTTTNHGFASAGQVTLSGIRDGAGNLVVQYNVGPVAYTKTGNKSFTFTIASTSPASPATGSMFAQIDTSKTISSLTRSGTTATATTVVAHGFTNGTTVSIGGTAGTNEGAYTGDHAIAGVTTNTFTYQVTVTPVSPATGTITVRKAGTSDRVALINWVRGQDNYGDEAGPGGTVTVRPSVHGDVLHSRPVVVNYGDARGTVVFYGANDGMFRAVNGNQTDPLTNWDGTSVPAGGELWSLVLPEHFGRLNRQRVNTPELKFPSTTVAGAQTKDYFVDGPTGTYQKLKFQKMPDGVTDDTTKPQVIDKAYLYLAMRRGGRFFYAVDVSTPNNPQVLWKIDQNTTGFSELGQTWSRPRLTLLNSYVDGAGKPIPVLVFGAGYDPAQDSEPPATNTMGRGIFVINAETGALVWSANSSCTTSASCLNVPGLVSAVPSEITFVDRDNDGRTDKLYFGDTAGNVWRADVSAAARTDWSVTKLAALGCSSGVCGSSTSPRKFFFPPAVVLVGGSGATGAYDAVMLASGDREHPLRDTATQSSYNVTNRVYFLKDTGTSVGTPVTSGVVESGGLFDATSTTYDGSVNGYYITFATGEKSVNAPITVYGTTYLGTNRALTPSATSCIANLGEAKGYAINPFTGSYGSATFDGGGLPPSPVAGLVGLELPDGTTLLRKFCIGCAGSDGTPGGSGNTPCNSALQNCLPNRVISSATRRIFWYTK